MKASCFFNSFASTLTTSKIIQYSPRANTECVICVATGCNMIVELCVHCLKDFVFMIEG